MLFRNRMRVLVVDDEPSLCKAFTIALQRAGYQAQSAMSGESALEIIRSQHVDILLIDLRIPDQRGDIVYQVASALQPHLETQTLFMTGDITEKGHSLIANCRCNFISKPFDLGVMLDAISALSPQVNDQTA